MPFGQSSSNFTACVCQNCKGQQLPPVQSHSFLAVKVACSIILYIKYDLQSVSGQEVFLVLRPNLLHISELPRICTTWHLHCTLRFSCFCYNDDMVPFRPFPPPIIIYKHTYNWKELRWGEEPKGPFPRIAHQTL